MEQSSFTIGRDASADIPIADNSVSRIHAEVTVVDGGRLFLTDRQSSNGTFVIRSGAARQVQQEKLLDSDTVQFGEVTIAVRDLLTAIRRKAPHLFGDPKLGGQGGGAGRQKPKPLKFATAAKLIRCHCGSVKATGEHCPSCGN